ncbi:calponin family repeat-containing domain protein [Ostertagia ostertagi]
MFNYYSKTTYDQYTSQSSPNSRNLGFPSYYYPTAYQKQPNHALSPRQAEAVERQAPTSAFTQKDPAPPPLNDTPNGPVHIPTKKNTVPHDYLTFIAAPVGHKSYGHYPEFTGISPKPAQGLPAEPHPWQVKTPKFAVDYIADENSYENDRRGQRCELEMRAKVRQRARWSVNRDEMIPDEQPNATMETKVTGQGQPKRVGRWTLAQLRQTDGIIPSQAGWNKGDSQKLMTNFGTPRNTSTRVKAENLQEIPEEIAQRTHGEVRLQSGTNKFSSQRGMTGFGTGRDVCREGKHVNTNPSDLAELPVVSKRLLSVCVLCVCKPVPTSMIPKRSGMTGFGTTRRETTKMLDTKHPEYDHERPDQSEIPLQSGTNKFASQKVDNNPQPNGFKQIRFPKGNDRLWTTTLGGTRPLDFVAEPQISGHGPPSIRYQQIASQQGMTGFGTIRNTTYEAEGGELPYEAMKISETIIPSQAGWNKGDSQKKMTSFGAPRDVKGKHLKRIWELEYPEEAEVSLDRL